MQLGLMTEAVLEVAPHCAELGIQPGPGTALLERAGCAGIECVCAAPASCNVLVVALNAAAVSEAVEAAAQAAGQGQSIGHEPAMGAVWGSALAQAGCVMHCRHTNEGDHDLEAGLVNRAERVGLVGTCLCPHGGSGPGGVGQPGPSRASLH